MFPIRGALLDIDGTLIDSNDAHALAWEEALADHGFYADPASLKRLIGMGGDQIVPRVTGLRDDEARAEAIKDRRAEIFARRYLPHLNPTPGAHELIAEMRRRG